MKATPLPITLPATRERRITLAQLSELLGVDRGNARRIALAIGQPLGIMPRKMQMPSSDPQKRVECRGQRQLTWSPEEIDQIIAVRREQGFMVPRRRGER